MFFPVHWLNICMWMTAAGHWWAAFKYHALSFSLALKYILAWKSTDFTLLSQIYELHYSEVKFRWVVCSEELSQNGKFLKSSEYYWYCDNLWKLRFLSVLQLQVTTAGKHEIGMHSLSSRMFDLCFRDLAEHNEQQCRGNFS